MASRKYPRDQYRPPAEDASGGQHPCSRQPPELCDGARIVVHPDGTTRRVPAFTPRAFCDPCQARIVTCLEELPAAYGRLEARIADPVRRSNPVRVIPGSRVLVSPDVYDLMSTMAAVLGGWAARVRRVPGLQLSDPGHPPGSPEAIGDACVNVLARHATPMLALQDGWTLRTFTYPAAAPGETATCRHCGREIARDRAREKKIPGRDAARWWLAGKASGPVSCRHEPAAGTGAEREDVIPASLLDLIGDREIVRQGEGWVTVLDELDGAKAGSEILDLHWRARKILGETRDRPESFDGVPCRNCDELALERAEPPSDPSLDAMHSKCAVCKDEMDREEFAQWAERYAGWARGAGIQVCRRCSLAEPRHEDCAWAACSCTEGEHPRRRAVA